MVPVDDLKIRQVLYSTFKALEVAEIPLLVSEDLGLERVSRDLASMIGGQVLRASAPKASAMFGEYVAESGYLLLHLDVPIQGELSSLLLEYLEARDILHPISPSKLQLHADHRLSLFAYDAMLNLQEFVSTRYLMEMCTVIRM